MPNQPGPQLSQEQLQILHHQISQRLGYLSKLIQRMDRRGFTPEDKLYSLATQAFHAMHQLRLEVHARAVGHGMGR